MPLQNRVDPFGEIQVASARGRHMGNRGVLHQPDRTLGSCRWRHKSWIICRLAWKGRRRAVMQPGRYTELFFMDEATALAAGHRPCALCRRQAYQAFQRAIAASLRLARPFDAKALDHLLHESRLDPRTRRQRRFEALADDLPDGCFFMLLDEPGQAWLLQGGQIWRWTLEGYVESRPRPANERVSVLTPRATVLALRAGYAAENDVPDRNAEARDPGDSMRCRRGYSRPNNMR